VTAAVRRARAPLVPCGAPAVAVLAGAVGLACGVAARHPATGAIAGAVGAILVWLATLDFQFRLLPNRIVLPAAALVLSSRVLVEPAHAAQFAAWSVGAGLVLLAAALARPGALGMGDVKLALLLGAALGSAVLPALAIGFTSIGVVGLVLAIRDGRQALKQTLPLAPFLAFGAIASLLLGAAG
jgi:leader peptidase (prepilin peptidase)/N-methyltransferase